MGRAVALREDFDGPALRRLAKASKDAGQSRRLLALAEIYDGGRRTAAARIGAVGLQVVRDWVLRFNAKGPDGLIDGKATGKPAKLNDRQRQALARLVESGPIPAIHGVVRWRRKDLAHWIFEEFRISVNGGGIMLHARRPGGPVAAAQNCATHGPLSVATRGRRCTAWSSMRRFDWRLSTRV